MKWTVKQIKKSWDYGIGRTAVACVCAHSVSISIGICQGYSAILIPQLIECEHFQISTNQGSWLASLGVITNPVGSVLSGVLAEYIGRKKAIQISSLPFMLGFLCIAMSKNIWALYAGRLISGIAGGMSSACYTYVSEISPPSKRGIFNSLGPISASTGILVTYVLGYLLPWWVVAYISCAFSVFTCISMHFMPESPPYLAKQDRKQQSLDSLMWLRRSNAIAQAEFENYKTSPADTGEDMSFKEKFLVPTTIKPFLILMGLFFLQESSGIYIILFYAVNFLQDANLAIDESLASITIGMMRLAISIFAAFLINRFGRKTLCIVSAAGMAASMLVTGIYSKYYEMYPEEVKILPLLPLICVLLNVFFCMIGMVPVPWIMTGELFPLRVRSIMAGVVMCMAQLFIFTSVKIYPDLQANLNFSGTVLLFFIASIISIFYAKYLLPETKNKRLEDIEEYFKSKKSKNLCGVDNQAFVIKPEVIDSEKGNKNFYSIDIASNEDKNEGKH